MTSFAAVVRNSSSQPPKRIKFCKVARCQMQSSFEHTFTKANSTVSDIERDIKNKNPDFKETFLDFNYSSFNITGLLEPQTSIQDFISAAKEKKTEPMMSFVKEEKSFAELLNTVHSLRTEVTELRKEVALSGSKIANLETKVALSDSLSFKPLVIRRIVETFRKNYRGDAEDLRWLSREYYRNTSDQIHEQLTTSEINELFDAINNQTLEFAEEDKKNALKFLNYLRNQAEASQPHPSNTTTTRGRRTRGF